MVVGEDVAVVGQHHAGALAAAGGDRHDAGLHRRGDARPATSGRPPVRRRRCGCRTCRWSPVVVAAGARRRRRRTPEPTASSTAATPATTTLPARPAGRCAPAGARRACAQAGWPWPGCGPGRRAVLAGLARRTPPGRAVPARRRRRPRAPPTAAGWPAAGAGGYAGVAVRPHYRLLLGDRLPRSRLRPLARQRSVAAGSVTPGAVATGTAGCCRARAAPARRAPAACAVGGGRRRRGGRPALADGWRRAGTRAGRRGRPAAAAGWSRTRSCHLPSPTGSSTDL